MLVFEERGKPENPEKNLSEQGREPTTNSTHIWRRDRESNPGHIGGRRVLNHCAIPAPLFVHQHCMGGGVACERTRTSVCRLGEGVGERNESAPVRSFHPYPPRQIPILAPRGAHTYAQRVGVNRLLVRSPVPGRLSGYGK